jgi:hypothetical protein
MADSRFCSTFKSHYGSDLQEQEIQMRTVQEELGAR